MTLSEAHKETAAACVPTTMPNVSAEAGVTILLDQSGDWMAADELRLALLEAQQEKKAVALHFGGLTHLETSSLQVLLAATKSMPLQFESVSEALHQGLRTAGAEALLGEAKEAA